MKGTAHTLPNHVQETGCLACNYDITFTEDIAVYQGGAEVLSSTVRLRLGLEYDPVLLLQIFHNVRLLPVKAFPYLEPDSHDLLSVPGMAPGVLPKPRVEPEVEKLLMKGAFYYLMQLL